MGTQAPRNVLADRYATDQTVSIWESTRAIRESRKLWIATLKALRDLGRDIPEDAIAAYEACVDVVDIGSIRTRERALRHSEKAEIEEFNAQASERLGRKVEFVHEGFTSRDKTDNVEQLQIRESAELMRFRHAALLARLSKRALEFECLALCGRSHLVPAQTITLGKRLANWLQEAVLAHKALTREIEAYPLRGIKGPMGTQQDMKSLLGSTDKALQLESRVAAHLGFDNVLVSTGQVYPRSLDYAMLTKLAQLAAAPANFAKMVRLMAGLGLMHEGGKQTGSTAMPHKVNSRTCERITGLYNILAGHVDMISRVMGDQWLEGDVSCSVVRRVALPDSFFTLDAILESAMTVLDEMEIFPGMIEAERQLYQPFLATTAILMDAVKRNVGRETAHHTIRQAALKAVADMRQGGGSNLLASYLSDSSDFPLSRSQELISQIDYGLSEAQVVEMCAQANVLVAEVPGAKDYKPAPIL